jgi:hypothetical protein
METTKRDSGLEPFEALIGTGATEARLFDGVVPGSIAFEWLEGGHSLIQRSRNDHELFPDAISIIGAPEAGTGWPWSTSRGVRRTYGVSLDDVVLRIWRHHHRVSTALHASAPPHASAGCILREAAARATRGG